MIQQSHMYRYTLSTIGVRLTTDIVHLNAHTTSSTNLKNWRCDEDIDGNNDLDDAHFAIRTNCSDTHVAIVYQD